MSTSDTAPIHKHREDDRDEDSSFHRIANILLRIAELICAVIVIAILARFCVLIDSTQVSVQGRLVYALVVACIAAVFSILFIVPINALSMAFPLDFILFVAWLVAFSLLAARSTNCTSGWYRDYWGYYWGRWWRTGPVGFVPVGTTGCSSWRTMLAFSFMASMAHLLSFILGVYVFKTYVKVKDSVATVKHHSEKLKPHSARRTGQPPYSNGTHTAQQPATAETGAPPIGTEPRGPVQQV